MIGNHLKWHKKFFRLALDRFTLSEPITPRTPLQMLVYLLVVGV